MASTSFTLGRHFEGFIEKEVKSGEYGTATEVVRDALRVLEEKKTRLAVLRAHLSEGEEQAKRGEYVNQTRDEMLAEFKKG